MSPWPCLWVLGERGIPEESRRIWGAEELRILLLVLQLSPGSRCPSASPCPAPRSSRGCSPPPSEWQFGNLWGFPLTGKRRHGAIPARGALFCFSLEFSGVRETLGLLKTLGIEPGGGRSGQEWKGCGCEACLLCFPKLRFASLCLCGDFGRNSLFNPSLRSTPSASQTFLLQRRGKKASKQLVKGVNCPQGFLLANESHVDTFFIS